MEISLMDRYFLSIVHLKKKTICRKLSMSWQCILCKCNYSHMTIYDQRVLKVIEVLRQAAK